MSLCKYILREIARGQILELQRNKLWRSISTHALQENITYNDVQLSSWTLIDEEMTILQSLLLTERTAP